MDKNRISKFISGILALSVFLNGCSVCGCKKDFFVFNEEVPNFTQEQKNIIRNIYNKAFSQLPEPERYYLKDLKETVDGYIVLFSPLVLLQSGSNKSHTQISFVSGTMWKVHFDKNLEVIRREKL